MEIKAERLNIIRHNTSNQVIQETAETVFKATIDAKYSYCFDWLERPIIQYLQDIVAFQELVSQVKPDLILETGIAHGGSLALSASLLCLLDVMEGLDPRQSLRRAADSDIDMRSDNKRVLYQHHLPSYSSYTN